MTVEDWDRRVPRGAERCVKCGREFGAGEDFVATVRGSSAGFAREDRCVPCGTELEAGVFSFWRGKRPTGQNRPHRLDYDSLLELFRRLDGHDDDQSRRLKWIVGILLLRRRLLVQVSRAEEEGREVLSLKLKHEDHVFRVADPGIGEEAFAAMQEDLARIFHLDPKPAG